MVAWLNNIPLFVYLLNMDARTLSLKVSSKRLCDNNLFKANSFLIYNK